MMSGESEHELPRPFKWLWLAFLLMAGLFVRVHAADKLYLTGDEISHVDIAAGETLADVMRYSFLEVHPPLFYFVLHYWMKLSSDPDFLRCLSLIFGMALIPLYYFIGLMVGGELAALCCATLVTFSAPCVDQAFTVKNYSQLLFLSSLGVYCFFRWRLSRAAPLLACYAALGCAAVASNFSGIFIFFCLALFGLMELMRAKSHRDLFGQWILANLLVAAFALFVYHQWQFAISDYELYPSSALGHKSNSLPWDIYLNAGKQLLGAAFLAPFIIVFYFYPLFPLLLAMTLYVFIPGFRRQAVLHPFFLLAGVASLVCMALNFFGAYPDMASRHSLWLLPLIFPAAGGMLASLLRVNDGTGIHNKAVIVLLVLSMGYDTLTRLADQREHETLPIAAWQGMDETLGKLGPHELIVTGNIGTHHLINSYRYRTDSAYTGQVAALVPYRTTHLLYSEKYFAILEGYKYSSDAMLESLKRAEEEKLLTNVDSIAIVNMGLKTPFYGLANCAALPHQIIYLPAEPGYAREELGVMLVPKQSILDDLLPPHGAARKCLSS